MMRKTMSQDPASLPVVSIDGDRLIGRLRRLAKIGARPEGGMNRQAFTDGDAESRRLVLGWAAEVGLEPATDAIGNLYLRYAPPGTEDQAPVVGGSHLDTQPAGGWLDGAYGVMAAFEAVQAIKELGVALARPVEIVAWVNEEGGRYQPGLMGSSFFTGHFDLGEASDIVDAEGTPLDREIARFLASTPDLPERAVPFPIAGVVEAHIEQGPILENEGKPIGVVEGVQGIRWFKVDVHGEAAHAGTAPLAGRRDALLAATRIIQALSAALADPDDVLRFTVGKMIVSPGSPNTVADHAQFSIDLRHPELAVLDRSEQTIRAVCGEQAAPCTAEVAVTEAVPPVRFDAGVVDTIEAGAQALDLPARRIVSGAGHDAAMMASAAPVGMVFVPCHKGISHHPAENADESDLIAGGHVVATALARLASR
jgi:N-carbamoyl-L-amino-acid hydrolase